MLRSLRLQNIGPSKEMMFQPKSRLNVITGDNGLGKSFLLDLAWWAVTRTWAGPPIQPSIDQRKTERTAVEIAFDAVSKVARLRADFDRPSQTWKFPKGQPGQPGLVVYARVDGDFAVWDSNRRFGDPDEDSSGIPKGLVFTREEVWNSKDLNGKKVCRGLLDDWVTWQQTGSWEFDSLKDTLRRLSPSEAELVQPGRPARADLVDTRTIPTLRMPYGQDVPLPVASAGMKRVIALAYLLVWTWREHLEISRISGRDTARRMLVIIDEVEAHLHPKWQRVILSAVVSALDLLTQGAHGPATDDYKPPKIQFIVATHSPLVLASLEPLFKPAQDALFELELEEVDDPDPLSPRSVVLRNPDFEPQGSAENWLVSDAFGLSSSRSVEAERLIDQASGILSDDARTDAQVRAMETRLAAVLSDIDPFWSRWRARLEARRPDA